MKHLILCFCLIVMTGCANIAFERPASNVMVVGQTSKEVVLGRMGKPFRTSTIMLHGESIEQVSFGHAGGADNAIHLDGTTPTRVLVYSFFNGVLIGESYRSSYADDWSDFDEKKATNITRGKTTKSEVEQLFGTKGGRLLYPLVKERSSHALHYAFSRISGNRFNRVANHKNLTITFNSNNVVTDVNYSTTSSE